MDAEAGYTCDGEDQPYSGHAYCDDGWFVSESRDGLQDICDRVSAFCAIFKVKINADKSHYVVARGAERSRTVCDNWRGPGQTPGLIVLWDHTASGGAGAWKPVSETRPDVAIRYLGVMIAGDGSAKAQVAKVVSVVGALIERVRTTKCSAALANYLFRACMCGRGPQLLPAVHTIGAG